MDDDIIVFLKNTQQNRNKKLALLILLGYTGAYRFYIKKTYSAIVMLVLYITAFISSYSDDLYLNIFGIIISLFLFFICVFDGFNLFKDYNQEVLDRLNLMENKNEK